MEVVIIITESINEVNSKFAFIAGRLHALSLSAGSALVLADDLPDACCAIKPSWAMALARTTILPKNS